MWAMRNLTRMVQEMVTTTKKGPVSLFVLSQGLCGFMGPRLEEVVTEERP